MRDPFLIALSYFQQAAAYYQQARYVESIQHYLSGLRYDQSRYYIYADLAKAYEMVGKWEQALKYLDIALQLCPDSPTVLRRKARINEEKVYYQSIIRESQLEDEPPSNFSPTLKSKNLPQPQNVVEYPFFILTVQPAVAPKTLWYICQLIEKTYNEVGAQLDCFPSDPISISIINTHVALMPTHVPKWAGGQYDGQIQLNYCADGEPELGVLYTLIRHEWTHLLVDILTNGNCPIWLNEGLAQTIARPLLSFEKLSLQRADKYGALPTLSELSQPFSQLSTSERKIAYLHSAAIVATLIDEGGYPSIRQLLCLLGNGTPIETAMRQTYKENVIPN
ncbi:MAG: tetratricopeptide repeat protein [Candidatus Poribacteria bacterium]|nr:tetratricopeptide repeat protein [Candidatus Poribacteria bacterium]